MESPEIKAALPIPYVLDRAGIAYEVGGDGRCHALCPFHDDSRPSFDVYGERLERWGCYPCGKGGDVFDLLEALGVVDCFADALELGEWMVGLLREDEWAGPTGTERRREFDFGAAARVVIASREDPAELIRFLRARPDLHWEAEQLHEEWAVGSIGGRVIIPYFDAHGGLMAYKHRTLDTKPISAAGSHFTDLYGVWRDSGSGPVLLVEGESDAWAADWWVGGDVSVLGVPTGAGTTPKFLERLEGRPVWVAFDGDVAGRAGAARWAQAIEGARVVDTPDGLDVADVGSGLANLIEEAVAPRGNAFLERFYPKPPTLGP